MGKSNKVLLKYTAKVVDIVRSYLTTRGFDRLVEIGPGKGAVTEHLLDMATPWLAIERDPGFAETLSARFEGPIATGGLTLRRDDFFSVPVGAFEGAFVFSCLPYDQQKRILYRLLFETGFSAGIFVVQEEVGRSFVERGRLHTLFRPVASFRNKGVVNRRSWLGTPRVNGMVVTVERHRTGPRGPVRFGPLWREFVMEAWRYPLKKERRFLGGLRPHEADGTTVLRAFYHWLASRARQGEKRSPVRTAGSTSSDRRGRVVGR